MEVPLDSLSVDVEAEYDPRAQASDDPSIPKNPYNFRYEVQLSSPASDEELARLQAEVERVCPILNLIRNPVEIKGSIVRAA
ncbi:OsmC family protein [Nonomuraea sp. NPDC048916]|uniref:OsmC family protein n=1 Tax=Nonomuraea sp. NPDC048916 TaxID=3154232 RepID=UPI0033FDFF30